MEVNEGKRGLITKNQAGKDRFRVPAFQLIPLSRRLKMWILQWRFARVSKHIRKERAVDYHPDGTGGRMKTQPSEL